MSTTRSSTWRRMESVSVGHGWRVLIIDVLATVAPRAAVDLLNQCGASVEALAVLMELDGLSSRSKLDGVTVKPLHVE